MVRGVFRNGSLSGRALTQDCFANVAEQARSSRHQKSNLSVNCADRGPPRAYSGFCWFIVPDRSTFPLNQDRLCRKWQPLRRLRSPRSHLGCIANRRARTSDG
jgi:hypothetical protein